MQDTAQFRQALLARKNELHSRLHRIEADLDQPMNSDSEERATEREHDEVLEGLGNAGLGELAAIEAALDRIEAGTFGVCAKCGEPISPERLKAVPHAALCEDCISH